MSEFSCHTCQGQEEACHHASSSWASSKFAECCCSQIPHAPQDSIWLAHCLYTVCLLHEYAVNEDGRRKPAIAQAAHVLPCGMRNAAAAGAFHSPQDSICRPEWFYT